MDSIESAKKAISKFSNKKRKQLVTVGTAMGLLASVFYPAQEKPQFAGASLISLESVEEEKLGSFPITIPTMRYGLVVDTFQLHEGTVARNQTLGSLLAANQVEFSVIENIIQHCKGKFDFSRDFKVGTGYTFFKPRNGSQPEYLVLEPNIYGYVVFHLNDNAEVELVKKPIDSVMTIAHGTLNSSLWEALTAQGVSYDAAAKMEDALQYSVDFSHAQVGDEFKLIYDQHLIQQEAVGSGDLHAAYYKRDGKEYHAFWFDNGAYKGYYDLEGRPAKRGFLQSPVKFTRISSKFNKRRFHPILKSVRPHLGTDYAAPHGTPIYAVADGTVAEASYSKGNGRYVKIKHDKVYQTQYLHMSRFAKGIRRGSLVKQGDVIGYVGSTGLATGPHVCFRFWKNGKQVNHLKEKLPQPKKLPDEVMEEFFQVRDKYLKLLEEPFTVQPTSGPDMPVITAP